MTHVALNLSSVSIAVALLLTLVAVDGAWICVRSLPTAS
jgi:hypothetical protein